MGVYIRDMEIPKSCRKCMISQPDGCGWICPIIESKPIVDGRVNSRHPHCPLVPVPPHGRLGDLDTVYRFAKDQLVKETGAFSKGINKALKDIMAAVRNGDAIPTIIPAEEGDG